MCNVFDQLGKSCYFKVIPCSPYYHQLRFTICPSQICISPALSSERVHCRSFANNTFQAEATFEHVSHAIKIRGGDDGTRTRDLCRDRAAF
jgi:hypothetical protein